MSPLSQAGVIVVNTVGPVPKFLVLTARKNPDHWIFPKGHIDPGETPEQAALRELREEAGIEGELLGRVGTSAFRSGDEDVEVVYYLVRFVTEVGPGERRKRQWLEYDEARSLLSFEDAKRLLDAAARSVSAR